MWLWEVTTVAGSGQAGDSGQSERKDTHVQELARSLNYAGNQRENKLEKGWGQTLTSLQAMQKREPCRQALGAMEGF